jgi:hypothetical protein
MISNAGAQGTGIHRRLKIANGFLGGKAQATTDCLGCARAKAASRAQGLPSDALDMLAPLVPLQQATLSLFTARVVVLISPLHSFAFENLVLKLRSSACSTSLYSKLEEVYRSRSSRMAFNLSSVLV